MNAPSAYTPEDEARDDAEIAAELVRAGWKSVSNQYRHIARLPEGKTGLEVLRACAPDEFRRIMEHAEKRAADTYLRMFAGADAGTLQTLDYAMFQAFRRAGGKSSW
jgi:hypothetical protein